MSCGGSDIAVDDGLEGSSRREDMHMHTLNQLHSLLKADKPSTSKKRMISDSLSPHHAEFTDGMDFNLRLVKEVRDRPYLFDVSEEAYNNSSWRNAAWTDLAGYFGVTPEQVKTRWKTLRDKFKKEDRKVKNGEVSSWPLYEALDFLLPHLRERMSTVGAAEEIATDISLDYSWKEEVRTEGREAEEGMSCGGTKKMRLKEGMEQGGEKKEESTQLEAHSFVPRSLPQQQQRTRMLSSPALVHSSSSDSPPSSSRPSHLLASPSTVSPYSTSMDTEEDEVFGHMIALRLSRMDARHKDQMKFKLMSVLFGSGSAGNVSSNSDLT